MTKASLKVAHDRQNSLTFRHVTGKVLNVGIWVILKLLP